MVVLTQNNLCITIPNKYNTNNDKKKIINDLFKSYFFILENINAIINATTATDKTSTTARSKNLYECAPVPGAPNMSLYLHKLINYIYL